MARGADVGARSAWLVLVDRPTQIYMRFLAISQKAVSASAIGFGGVIRKSYSTTS